MRLIGLEDQHCWSLSKGTCNVFGREHIAVSFGVMRGGHLNSILASDNSTKRPFALRSFGGISHSVSGSVDSNGKL